MKCIPLLLLSALPLIASAQTLFTSVHGGIAYFNSSKVTDPYGSIRVMAERKRLQFGGALDFSFGNENRSFSHPNRAGHDTIYRTKHVTFGIAPNIVGNYKIPVGKSYLYTGANLGIYYYPTTTYSLVLFPAESDYFPMRHIRYRVAALLGAQAGCSFYLSRSFDLNMEVAVKYVPAPGRDILYFPLSVGMRHKPVKRIKKADQSDQPNEADRKPH